MTIGKWIYPPRRPSLLMLFVDYGDFRQGQTILWRHEFEG